MRDLWATERLEHRKTECMSTDATAHGAHRQGAYSP